MNIRIASLLTALLFLSAPLALTPAATAAPEDCIDQNAPSADPECLGEELGLECPEGITVGDFPFCMPTPVGTLDDIVTACRADPPTADCPQEFRDVASLLADCQSETPTQEPCATAFDTAQTVQDEVDAAILELQAKAAACSSLDPEGCEEIRPVLENVSAVQAAADEVVGVAEQGIEDLGTCDDVPRGEACPVKDALDQAEFCTSAPDACVPQEIKDIIAAAIAEAEAQQAVAEAALAGLEQTLMACIEDSVCPVPIPSPDASACGPGAGADVDSAQFALCTLFETLGTVAEGTETGRGGVLAADSDGDGVYDYAEVILVGTFPIGDFWGSAGRYDGVIFGNDGCGLDDDLNPEDDSPFGCIIDLVRITARIDLVNGANPSAGFADPLLSITFLPGFEDESNFYADGNLLLLDAVHAQDPRNNFPRYYLTADLDDDGSPDLSELLCFSNFLNGDATCADPDGDGLGDANGDGIEDRNGSNIGTDPFDPDSDDDGMKDGVDPLPTIPGPFLDSDLDGVPDKDDNCDFVVNPDQRNTDDGFTGTPGGDGSGDACDSDDDADGLSDAEEAAFTSSPVKRDTDGDGVRDDVERNYRYASPAHGFGGAAQTGSANPNDTDSDDDGATDGQEVNGICYNPGNGSPAVPSAVSPPSVGLIITSVCPPPSTIVRSNPIAADTDADGINDKAEHTAKTDPRDSRSPGGPAPPMTIPDPVKILFDPNCDTTKIDSDPDCRSTPPSPGLIPIPGIDTQDSHDTDDDGNFQEPNGQVDVVESRLFWVDPDEAGDTSLVGYEGRQGATLYIQDPNALPNTRLGQVLRIGDVAATPDAVEVLVFEDRTATRMAMEDLTTPSDRTMVCVYQVDGGLRLAITQDTFVFGPGQDPCGTRDGVYEIVNNLLPGGFLDEEFLVLSDFFGETFTWRIEDSNKDGIADGVSFNPDPTTCPDPTSYPLDCDGELVVPGGGLPVAPEDILATIDALLAEVQAAACGDESAPGPAAGTPPCGGGVPDPATLPDVVLATLLGELCANGVEDACPSEPCTPDTDGDGVCDEADDCPGTPAGTTVGSDGCVAEPDPCSPATFDPEECDPSAALCAEGSPFVGTAVCGEVPDPSTLPDQLCAEGAPLNGTVFCGGPAPDPTALAEELCAEGMPFNGTPACGGDLPCDLTEPSGCLPFDPMSVLEELCAEGMPLNGTPACGGSVPDPVAFVEGVLAEACAEGSPLAGSPACGGDPGAILGAVCAEGSPANGTVLCGGPVPDPEAFVEGVLEQLCAEGSPANGTPACGGGVPDPTTVPGILAGEVLAALCANGVELACPSEPCTPDTDGDGVCDGSDACPGTPPGTSVGSDGCPKPADPCDPTSSAFNPEECVGPGFPPCDPDFGNFPCVPSGLPEGVLPCDPLEEDPTLCLGGVPGFPEDGIGQCEPGGDQPFLCVTENPGPVGRIVGLPYGVRFNFGGFIVNV